ncbi:MAG: hypothetical protein WBG36_03910 [Ornithinimicrobium sp.]
MDEFAANSATKPLQDRRRRILLAGSAGAGLLVTAVAAWVFLLQGPDKPAENQADSETSTTQSRDADSGNTEESDGALKQVGAESAPRVSNVAIEPAAEPVASDKVEELAKAPVADMVVEAELATVDEQVAEADAVFEEETREMDEALTAYQETQAQEARDFDDTADVPPADPEVLDDLESDAADLNAELNESLEGLDKP